MRHAVFISRTEELLLVDETGLARIFSLVTEQFRYVTIIMINFRPNNLLAPPHTRWILARSPFMLHQTEPHSSFWTRAVIRHGFCAITSLPSGPDAGSKSSSLRVHCSMLPSLPLVWEGRKVSTVSGLMQLQRVARRSSCASPARQVNMRFVTPGDGQIT